MHHLGKGLIAILGGAFVLLALSVLAIWARHGGGDEFPDMTTAPTRPAEELEQVASLPLPPCNISVSPSGRVFFTFHPEAKPAFKVLELVDGSPVPYPSAQFQSDSGGNLHFQGVQSVRVDRQNRLWALDLADHGLGQARLLAFDLDTNELVHRYDFPSTVAPVGSHLNDFQIDAAGEYLYIADASVFAKTPAIIVYDIAHKTARRVLEDHPSVVAEHYVPVVQGKKMLMFGIFAVRPNVDSIALDRKGEWLYYAPTTSRHMYRVPAANLTNTALSPEDLAASVERFAPKTMSDGIAIDDAGNIYISDADQSAILTLGPDKQLTTLFKDEEKLRWPDGFSFGPNQWLYITASSLQDVIMQSPEHIREHAPYHIFRFKVPVGGYPGH